MRKLVATCVLLLASLVPAAAAPPSILVLGDSLSSGYGVENGPTWTTLLQRHLAEAGLPHRVVNASVSGDTTQNGLSRLPPLLAQHNPHTLIIELGGNDGLRGLSLRAMTGNLQSMIEQAQASGAQVVLVAVRLPPNYGHAYTERFARVFQDVAQTFDIALVPQFLDGIAEDFSLMQPDGIHPTAAAQSIMLQNVLPALLPLLESGQRSSS